jgi:hypothetical protein
MSANGQTIPNSTRTRYGAAHPEPVENGLWLRAMREEWSAYDLRRHLGVEFRRGEVCEDFSVSAYRDAAPGPFWSWQRYGRTSTKLPDGRVIHIAGEHEDSYDPDFCIYNDVIVEYPDGRLDLCLYPKDVFPPTDFHTATLIGEDILLIGSLGYRDMRRPGEMQMLKLDTRTLRIEPVEARGVAPGWISQHQAEMLDEKTIVIIGGMVQTADGYEPNTGVFVLDLATMTWREGKHGDMALFAVSEADYRRNKNPRHGAANPERSDNPFWREMLRRQWPPSRARLHFGDFAPPQAELILSGDADPAGEMPPDGTPEAEARAARLSAAIERSKLVRTIDDIVWTAMREDSLKLSLPDGRHLQVGGEINDFGDEYADPWVYNDVIVTHPDRKPEILIYPREIFPHLIWLVGAAMGKDVYIFGIFSRTFHPDRPRGPAVLRLDTASYEIANLSVAAPPARVNLYPGCDRRDGNCVIFPVVRDRKHDPEHYIAFDLETLSWSGPFPRTSG